MPVAATRLAAHLALTLHLGEQAIPWLAITASKLSTGVFTFIARANWKRKMSACEELCPASANRNLRVRPIERLSNGRRMVALHTQMSSQVCWLTDGTARHLATPTPRRANHSSGWRSSRRSCRPACSRSWRARDRRHRGTRRRARCPA